MIKYQYNDYQNQLQANNFKCLEGVVIVIEIYKLTVLRFACLSTTFPLTFQKDLCRCRTGYQIHFALNVSRVKTKRKKNHNHFEENFQHSIFFKALNDMDLF